MTVSRLDRRMVLLLAALAVLCSLAAIVGFEQGGSVRMQPDVPAFPWIAAWTHWDAGWYAEIAANGYWYRPGEQSPVAFFPSYALLVRAATALGLNRFTAGVILTTLLGPLGIFLVFRWAKRLVDERTAFLAAALLAVYPFAYYLHGAMYSDSLFLFTAAAAFLALEDDRPVLAALLGAVATACRPIAPGVVLGLLARQVERRRARGENLRPIDVVPALSGVGLLLYMGYLQWKFGDALAFVHVQSAPSWAQPPGWRTWLKVELFHQLFPRVPFWVGVRMVAHAVLGLGALALAWPTAKRLGWGYGVYVAVVVGIPVLSTKDFMGVGRYLIAAFPVFLTLATMIEARPRLSRGWLAVSAVILLLMARAYGAGEYLS